MKCPFCSAEDTRVIDSRPTDDNASIRRRRQCPVCGKRFTTYEKIETLPLIVIKKDNNREPYDRSKIEAGIVRFINARFQPLRLQRLWMILKRLFTTERTAKFRQWSSESLSWIT